jgi:ribosomal protein L10
MNKELKTFKLYKVKQYFKNQNLVFFFHTTHLNSKNSLKIEQALFNYGLKCHKITNTVTRYALKNSIMSNSSILINGSLCLVCLKKNKTLEIDLQKLLNINKTMPVLGVKLNKKIYSKQQLSTLSTLDRTKNIKVLNKMLKKLLKIPNFKLKK